MTTGYKWSVLGLAATQIIDVPEFRSGGNEPPSLGLSSSMYMERLVLDPERVPPVVDALIPVQRDGVLFTVIVLYVELISLDDIAHGFVGEEKSRVKG